MPKEIIIDYNEIVDYNEELADKNVTENDFSGSETDGVGGEE